MKINEKYTFIATKLYKILKNNNNNKNTKIQKRYY